MTQTATWYQVFCLLLVVVVATTACQQSHNDPTPEAYGQQVANLRFEQQEFYRVSDQCQEDTTHCARISASYPLLISGPEQVVQAVNDTITQHVKANIAVFAVDPSELLISLDSIATQYILEFESLLAESPDYPFAWEIEVDGEVIHHTPKLVTVALSAYSYTGGAHPNSAVDLLNFDARTGRKLVIKDLFTDQQKVKTIVENKFREVREIEAGVSMNDAGFFWGEPFALPQNFALRKDGIYFYYNPYEAAAYALGPTDFTIPYTAFEGLLREGIL